MKSLFLILSFVPPAWAINPASERTFTLQDSIQLALLNNAEVLSAEQQLTIAEERVKEARYLFLPELGVWASATRYDVDSIFSVPPELGGTILTPAGVGLPVSRDLVSGRLFFVQTLYAGRRGVNTLQMAKTAREQARSDYDIVRLDVKSRAKKVFYELLATQRRDAAIRSALEQAQALGADKLSAFERVEAERQLDRLRELASESGKALEAGRLAYLQALNLELNTSVSLDGSLDAKPAELDLTRAAVWAIELRPELKSQVFKARVDAIGVNLALGRRLPTVLVGGTYEVLDDDVQLSNRNWHMSLAVRFPISYNFWSQLRQKRAEQRQGLLRRSSLEDQVRLEVRTAHEELSFWQKERPRREQAFERLGGLFAEADGAKGPRALAARVSLLESELAWLEAVQKELVARAELERAVGRDLE